MKSAILLASASAAFAVASLVSPAAWAGTLEGDTVHAIQRFPDIVTTNADLGTSVVGVSDPTFPDIFRIGILDVDITGNQIILNFTGAGTGLVAAFDGIEFIDQTHAFSSAALSSTDTPGIAAGAVFFSGGGVFVNFSGIAAAAGENIKIDVTTEAGVPEPPAWALMILGFGSVGFALRSGARTGQRA